MSTYETATKSLLQGVSQQIPQERLPGQLTAQVNMLSDPVTNLRRRHGLTSKITLAWTGVTSGNMVSWFTDIAGQRVHVFLNIGTGQVRVLDEAFTTLATLEGGEYLTTGEPRNIRACAVRNEFFLGNVKRKPVIFTNDALLFGAPLQNPARGGFFYIPAGAFGKTFTVTANWGSGTVNASYTTPGGTGAGDAALSTSEYIATQLYNQLLAGAASNYTIQRDGPYCFLQTTTHSKLLVTTTNSTQYTVVSNSGYVTSAGLLPARLPATADRYPCRVGTGKTPSYFMYDDAKTEWVEYAAYGEVDHLENCPVSIYWTGSAFALSLGAFEGSTAGDQESNPNHEWMTEGFTGMGTYQGRLVLMSGPMVSLSSSKNPRRFFRTTVSSVVNSDGIEIGSSLASSASYEWAVPYQKDLLLFSRGYQAVIPSANTALTPANATVVPTSSHETDTTCAPLSMGRTLMYCKPRSEEFFGMLEMAPSGNADSMYTSQDSTPHLPKYMPGRCRLSAASSVASMAVFSPTGDKKSLIVHEYHWDADTKVQQAWHQWTFEYQVATVHFASDQIILTFAQNDRLVIGAIDPRASAVSESGQRRPYLDLNITETITDHIIPIPASIRNFDPTIANKLVAVVASGPLAGELVGTTVTPGGASLTTVLSWPSGTVKLGIPYYSGVVPSPPLVTDYKDQVVHSGKATLLRYNVGTANSSEFMVRVDDKYSTGEPGVGPTLSWSSPELELGQALFSDQAVTVVPCRTDLRTTQMEVWTEGTGELNLTSLEYVAKFNPKITRR